MHSHSSSLCYVMAHVCNAGQALVLMYEFASKEEYGDYLPRILWPLQPLAIHGRSWKAAPRCHPSQAVYDNWMDRFHLMLAQVIRNISLRPK